MGGSTITLGQGSVATLGSQVISAPSSGGVVIGTGSDEATVQVAASATPYAGPQSSVITLGSQTLTVVAGASGQDVMLVGSTTLTLSAGGAAATIGSQVLSQASNGNIVAQSGSYSTTLSVGGGVSTAAGQLTLGSQTVGFTQIGSEIIVGGQTLRPGHTVTISGETVALNSQSQVLVISGSQTSTERSASD